MKTKAFIFFSLFLGVVLSMVPACKKEVSLPTLTTNEVTSVTGSSAICGGSISSDGGGDITARGVCWGTTSSPTVDGNSTVDGSGTGNFSSSISGLSSGTTYYVRAYATNSAGTAYGMAKTFTTSTGSLTVTDFDGNVYHTITIGSQVWMKENLKVTHYRNGDAIQNVSDNSTWEGLTSGAYCNYGNSTTNGNSYGRLYNGFAVSDSRNIAPAGWHVPTQAEWNTLISYLGGASVAGGKLKSTTIDWNSPNTGATDAYGFSALPAGYRECGFALHGYYDIQDCTYFWTSSSGGCFSLYHYTESIVSDTRSSVYGHSVRCIKD